MLYLMLEISWKSPNHPKKTLIREIFCSIGNNSRQFILLLDLRFPNNSEGVFMKKETVRTIFMTVAEMIILSLLFLSCGDGNGDGIEKTKESAIYPPAVFIANKNINGVNELYASFDDGADIVKLSNNLVAGGDVVAFLISPDGLFAAYVADQDTDGVFELYAVVVDKTIGDTAVKISGGMNGNGIQRKPSGEYAFGWAPDSSRIAYIADQNTAGVFELFTSTPDGIENDMISDLPDPTLNPGRDVQDFEWEPNTTLIAYVADQDTNDTFELYVSPSDSNIGNRKVSGIPMVGTGIREISPIPSLEYLFGWAPDNSRLAYIADQDTLNVFELYTSTPDGASTLSVSGPMGADGDVDEFAWAPNSSKIAYLADQLNSIGIELYTTFPNASGTFLKNSSGLILGSNVVGLEWAPDSSRIAFIANKIVSMFALYTTSPSNSTNVLVSSGGLIDSEVIAFSWAPDSSMIAYIADDFSINEIELFTTLPATPFVTRISGDLIAEGDVIEFDWAPNSSRVAYISDQDTNDVFELYSSTPDGKINDILSEVSVFGGDVQEFKWAPDASGVGYRSDQDSDNVIELFASQPNGDENTKLSGNLVRDGDVIAFDWVP
jgi:hypothetical protein